MPNHRLSLFRLFPLLLALLLTQVACGAAPFGQLPEILYIAPDAAGVSQLVRQRGEEGRRQQISAPTAGEVIDFAAAPDGRQIVYSVSTGGGSDLRIVNSDGTDERQLLACPAAECSTPVWSPDGRRLSYERRELEGGVAGQPYLYWLDPASGETVPLIAGVATPSYGARFSPDGALLSYVSPADEGIVVYRLAGGEQRLISSRVGRPAAFSPDSASVVVGDLVPASHDTAPESGDTAGPPQESTSVYLYLAPLGEGERTRLSPPVAVDDSAPAWSPDGQWIAFGRTPADVGAGRQLWLMRPDGSEARALTDDPALSHGPPAWSTDGQFLLYQRFDPATGQTSVWRLDVAGGETTLLSETGYLPAWACTTDC